MLDIRTHSIGYSTQLSKWFWAMSKVLEPGHRMPSNHYKRNTPLPTDICVARNVNNHCNGLYQRIWYTLQQVALQRSMATYTYVLVRCANKCCKLCNGCWQHLLCVGNSRSNLSIYSKHRTLIFISQHIPQALDNPLKRDKKN